MASKWGTWTAQSVPRFLAIDEASFEAIFPMSCLRWAQLGVKPHGFNLESIWIAWGPTSELAPSATWAQVFRAAKGQVGPNLSQFYGPNATCWKLAILHILLLFPSFFGFDGFVRAYATLGLSWPQLRCQMPPHRTKLRMLSPTCLQTWANCAIFDTSWAQVGPLSWAPRMARFDPSRLWLAKYARSFPLYPILWVRAVLVAKRREYIYLIHAWNPWDPKCWLFSGILQLSI